MIRERKYTGIDDVFCLDGLSSLPKNSIVNASSGGQIHADQLYQLPNVPVPTNLSLNKTNGNWIPRNGNNTDMMELSPEEAAEVVNHFLQSEPTRKKNIDTRVG